MDAMVTAITAGSRLPSDGPRRLTDLWHLPLLMVSLALSLCTAYLFVDAQPALAFNQKIASVRQLLDNERPEAAAQSLTRLVASERLPREHEAAVHLLLAESIDAAQKQSHAAPAGNYQRIIEESQIALAQGVKPTGEVHRRIGECYEALDKPAEAASEYRQAIALDPGRSLRLQRKVIDLQMAASDWVAVEASLDAYRASSGISDAERAWAENQKADLLIDRGAYVDARRLLEDALRLDADAIAQAQTRYRLGLCAWKVGKVDDAQTLIATARSVFNHQHPLDAAAAVALGSIAQEKSDLPKAIGLFDEALAAKPDSVTALRAHLARASCELQKHADDSAVADLRQAVELSSLAPQPLKDQTVESVRSASKALATRENFSASIDVLGLERSLDANVSADLHGRMASAYENRAEQIGQSIAESNGAERVQRTQMCRDFRCKAADEYLATSRALATSGDKNYDKLLWKAIDLLDAAGNRPAIASALELWASERATDAITPDALERLGKTYAAMGQTDEAIGAYQRLQGAYPQAAASARAAMPLATLYLAKDASRWPTAVKVLGVAVASNDASVRCDALLEVARIEHRENQDADALPQFVKFAQDYPTHARIGEVNFLAAECSSHLASQIDAKLVSASASTAENGDVGGMTQAVAARKKLVQDAASFYDKATAFYAKSAPTRDEDRRYQKLAVLRRADCAYDLGDYDNAVKMYQAAVKDLSEPSQLVAANVQIANAYFAMHKPEDAKAAAERAKQLLHQYPTSGSSENGVAMPAAYWEQWLKWTGSGGTW